MQKLPNATAVLVLGIFSILGCCCYGVVGLICGIVGLSLAKKDLALYNANPGSYSDFQNLNTGKILCYVGIGLSALYIIYIVVMLSTVGWEAMTNPALMQEKINDIMGK